METKIYTMNIFPAGGNASKSAVAHKISVPTTWAKMMGFTMADRTAKLTFTDDHRIIIEKCSNEIALNSDKEDDDPAVVLAGR